MKIYLFTKKKKKDTDRAAIDGFTVAGSLIRFQREIFSSSFTLSTHSGLIHSTMQKIREDRSHQNSDAFFLTWAAMGQFAMR